MRRERMSHSASRLCGETTFSQHSTVPVVHTSRWCVGDGVGCGRARVREGDGPADGRAAAKETVRERRKARRSTSTATMLDLMAARCAGNEGGGEEGRGVGVEGVGGRGGEEGTRFAGEWILNYKIKKKRCRREGELSA